MGKKCQSNGGEWNKPSLTCTYLDEAEQLVEDLDTRPIEEKYGLREVIFKKAPKTSTVMAKLIKSEGEVFIWSTAFQKWTGPEESGALIYNGDFVLTKERGAADIVLYGKDGQDRMSLRPDSKVYSVIFA